MLTQAQNEALSNLHFIRRLIVAALRKDRNSPELDGLLVAEAAANQAFVQASAASELP
jgi:hypothetical protein